MNTYQIRRAQVHAAERAVCDNLAHKGFGAEPDRDQAFHRLERELAYAAARSDIETLALRVNGWLETPARWNVNQFADWHNDAELLLQDRQDLARAVQYLDWLGCLERDPDEPAFVTIKALP